MESWNTLEPKPSVSNVNLIKKCYKLIESRSFEDAFTIFEHLEGQTLSSQEQRDINYLKGLIFMSRNEFEEAIKVFEKIRFSAKDKTNFQG